jgi:uncharacterized protein (TIGR00725 family)
MEENRHEHLKYKICVSGAAETGHCAPDALEKAKEIGKHIAKSNAVIVTGATTGFPYWSAVGAKEAGGFSIGLSPAINEREHVEHYKLPLDYMDIIIYTGFGYSGRNLLLTRSSDAVIVGCGRWGTMNEFTIALEDGKPIGVLDGAGGSIGVIRDMIAKSDRGSGNIIFESDPEKLVEKIIERIKDGKVEQV